MAGVPIAVTIFMHVLGNAFSVDLDVDDMANAGVVLLTPFRGSNGGGVSDERDEFNSGNGAELPNWYHAAKTLPLTPLRQPR